MAYSAAEVADRLAIQDLIGRYAVIVDSGDFDALDDLFTPDAEIDFSTFNGPVGGLAEIKTFLDASLPFFTRTQHMMGLPLIDLDGDTAHARTSCNNPMISTKPDGTVSVWLIGLWYDDELVRSDEGWRFSARNQIRSYTILGLNDTPLGV
ncbi:MAG TPA: nuclear transport factor 2 family protein [Mycobacteriales bacterium]|jgi:ketosteroid isomerase-like protein|nr:nuclear transport factor 2 family protein [Mycobacteriales bacterium]